MLAVCAVCQAQKFGIKPNVLYHKSVSSQKEPVFHNINASYWQGRPLPFESYSRFYSEDFTLANGWEYGLAVS